MEVPLTEAASPTATFLYQIPYSIIIRNGRIGHALVIVLEPGGDKTPMLAAFSLVWAVNRAQ